MLRSLPLRHMPVPAFSLVLLLALQCLPCLVNSLPATVTDTFTSSGNIPAPDSRSGNAVFYMENIVFPVAGVNDGCLFHFGGSTGTWAGILNDKFVVQAGVGSVDVLTSSGADLANTGYVILSDYPQDGNAHTVLIHVSVGHVVVYIDCQEKGVGHGSISAWTGGDAGSFLAATSSTVPAGAVKSEWKGDSPSGSLKLYTAAALFPFNPTDFECSGFCTRADVADCDVNSVCSLNASQIPVCTCNPYLDNENGHCIHTGPETPAHAFGMAGVVDHQFTEEERTADVAFFMEGITFPSNPADGCLFHMGGSTGVWAGILHGKFHVQAGTTYVPVTEGDKLLNTAYVISDGYPKDDNTHTVLVYISPAKGEVRVYIGCDDIGGSVKSLASMPSGFTGGNEGSYLSSTSGVPTGTSTAAWPGLSRSESMLKVYTAASGSDLFTPWTPFPFGCDDFCSKEQATDCDPNSVCSIDSNGAVCTCNPYFIQEDASCVHPGPAEPTAAYSKTHSFPALDSADRKKEAVFFMEGIIFPSSPVDGCLFHLGGAGDGLWAGILNGSFHVQAGTGAVEVKQGDELFSTAYVIFDDFPTDGLKHKVLVYVNVGDAMEPGQVRVYIDCVQKGVGTTSGGALLGSSESFAGGDEGSYLEPSSNTVPVGTVQGAWPGLDGSESMIKIYTSLDVPTLFAPWTPAHFECPGFCSPAEAAACDVAAECSLEDSIATCTCDKFYEGNGTECQVSGPPGMTMAWLPGTFDGLEREWYEADGAFLVEGIKFPIGVEVNNTDKDGQLFHTGGQTDSIWVGIYNGMFHVQAGASGTATLKSLANTAVFRTSDFPQDDIEHYILILAEVGESGRSTGKVTVWIDCYLKGSAETTGLALGTQGRFSGPDSGAYLVGGQGPEGCPTNRWQGPTGTGGPLRFFSSTGLAADSFDPFVEYNFGCTGACLPNEVGQCDENAICTRGDTTFDCSCNRGWEGPGATCEDIKECNLELTTDVCHFSAFCQETPGSYTCMCQPGFVGDGFDCYDQSWGIRTVFELPSNDRRALTPTEIETLKLTYGKLVLFDPVLPPNASVVTGMPFSFGALNFGESIFEVVESESGGQITFFALFRTKGDAEWYAAELQNVSASYWDPIGTVADGPKVYRWESQTTSNALQVNPTGLTVDFVYFDPTCLASGCWKVEVTYTVGIDNFNVFFLPRASSSDQLSYDFDYSSVEYSAWDDETVASTFFPANHPCHSHDASDALTAAVSSCCIPQFLDMYRPVTNFIDAVAEIDGLSASLSSSACGTGARTRPVTGADVPIFATKSQAVNISKNIFPRPAAPENPELRTGVFIDSPFAGMTSYINHTGVVDAYIGIYTAILCLDEVELRTLAGQLKGTVGVEHTVDTFIGLAEFSPTGIPFLDPNAVQTNIHLEKTSFFSVSTHGVNDYTFLEYVNLRLVAIYNEDADFSGVNESTLETVRTSTENAAHYIQVTFTMGSKYDVNDNAGLIPLDSVRAGKGIFFDDDDLEHKCLQYTDGSFPEVASFNASLLQDCAPAATMCISPASVPDQFVAFNIPLGVDWFDPPSSALDNNVFVHMVINAIDTVARGDSGETPTDPNGGQAPWQMKTTLSASIPVVAGGINIFCDGITAKTDLKDVANADIVVGSASSDAELTRLRILEDVASTQLATAGPQEINTDSIESGLMTLVLKGNSSYFELGGNVAVSIELEDLITIHIMEDDGSGADNAVAAEVLRMLRTAADDNSDSNGLITDGYALNEAFYFTIDRSAQRAHLEPSIALSALCPWNPTRPAAGVSPLITCVTRRDVQFRNFPWRTGAVSTAMEICAADNANVNTGTTRVACEDCCDNLDSSSDESTFMTTILGDSVYAKQLAIDFAQAIDTRYTLNGRYRRAFWINPGYEWTPTQTGGNSIFSLSQKIFVYALITLDEDISSDDGKSITTTLGFADTGPELPSRRRRRMLLQAQTGDALTEAEASAGSAYVTYEVTQKSMMAQAYKVPADRVATWKVNFQLTDVEACMGDVELQVHLRTTLVDQLSNAVSKYNTLQITSLSVDRAGVKCDGRRKTRSLLSGFSEATADATMLVVFDDEEEPFFNTAVLESMSGVNSVAAIDVADIVEVSTDVGEKPPASSSSDSSRDTALIAGIAGGIAGAVLLAAGVVLVMRSRGSSEAEAVPAVQTINVDDLKAQLAHEV